jgi:hypothetical protein
MKRSKHPMLVVFATGVCLFGVLARGSDTMPSNSSATGTVAGVSSGQDTNQSGAVNSQRTGDATIEEMKRTLDAARRHQINPPLPNFVTGPGLPPPIGVNFYSINWHYPHYLLCEYAVSENHYDRSNEPAWFKAALLQIRGYGPDRFPPIRWIAVLVCNVAEPGGTNAIAETSKVGAIFDASEVFDRTRDESQLIAQATMDRHPFMYDPKQPTPGEQQRWLIVERHAAAIGTTTNSNENVTGSEPHK